MSDSFLLTPKQKLILEFIASFRVQNGYAPSQQEIARHFGFKSLGTVQDYLVRLERQGALQKAWNARRGMKVVSPTTTSSTPSSTVPLPLCGKVAAGRPIEALTDGNGQGKTVDVPASMIGRGEHFVLQVSGDSMIEDGIFDGDYVVIKKQSHAENGQTVVALIDNEATIKRLQRKGSAVELHPANAKFRPIVVRPAFGAQDDPSFKIEGILSGLIRLFK